MKRTDITITPWDGNEFDYDDSSQDTLMTRNPISQQEDTQMEHQRKEKEIQSIWKQKQQQWRDSPPWQTSARNLELVGKYLRDDNSHHRYHEFAQLQAAPDLNEIEMDEDCEDEASVQIIENHSVEDEHEEDAQMPWRLPPSISENQKKFSNEDTNLQSSHDDYKMDFDSEVEVVESYITYESENQRIQCEKLKELLLENFTFSTDLSDFELDSKVRVVQEKYESFVQRSTRQEVTENSKLAENCHIANNDKNESSMVNLTVSSPSKSTYQTEFESTPMKEIVIPQLPKTRVYFSGPDLKNSAEISSKLRYLLKNAK